MKTLKFKFVMPILALLFAMVASAFTVFGNSEAPEDALITGYINNPTPCQPVQVDCEPGAQQTCTSGGDFVYDKNSATVCNKPLTKRIIH